jgi:hypothetical protein
MISLSLSIFLFLHRLSWLTLTQFKFLAEPRNRVFYYLAPKANALEKLDEPTPSMSKDQSESEATNQNKDHVEILGPNSSLQNRLVRWGVSPLYKLRSSFLSNRRGTKSTPSKTSQHKATRGRSELRWNYQHTPSRSDLMGMKRGNTKSRQR